MTTPERPLYSTADPAEWIAVLGHELRSPIAAILGYLELLQEGMFGTVPEAALESIRRIGFSTRHLLLLVEGIEYMAGLEDVPEPPTAVSAMDLSSSAIDIVRPDAETRGTTLVLTGNDVEMYTIAGEAIRAFALALGAAVKVSPETTLEIAAASGEPPSIIVTGSLLDPDHDSVATHGPLSGAALRLELARSVARHIRGSIHLQPDGTLRLEFPRLPIDGAEHLP